LAAEVATAGMAVDVPPAAPLRILDADALKP
jgi:hypothetical protein